MQPGMPLWSHSLDQCSYSFKLPEIVKPLLTGFTSGLAAAVCIVSGVQDGRRSMGIMYRLVVALCLLLYSFKVCIKTAVYN